MKCYGEEKKNISHHDTMTQPVQMGVRNACLCEPSMQIGGDAGSPLPGLIQFLFY